MGIACDTPQDGARRAVETVKKMARELFLQYANSLDFDLELDL